MITKSYYQLMSRFKPTYRYPCLIILLALIVIESISYVNCNNTGSGGTGGIQNTTKTTFNLGSLTGLWYRVYATGKSDCLTLEIVHNVETKQYDLIERKNFQLISRLQSSVGADGIIRLKRNETGYPLSLKILSTDLANYFMIHFVDLTKNLAAVGVYTRDKPETLDDDLLDVCNRTLNKTGIKLPLRPVEYLNCQSPPLVDSSLGGTRDVDEVVLPNRPTLATLLYKTIGTWYRVYSSSGDGFISFTYVSIQGSQPPLFRILIRQSSTDYLSGHMIVDADGHKYTVIRDDNNQQLATIECLNYEINSYFIFKITDNNNKVNIYVFTPTPVQNPTVLNIAKQTLQRLGLDIPLQTNVVNDVVDGSANTKTTADNTNNNQIPPSSVTSDTDNIMSVPDSTMADQLRKVPSIETLTTKLTGRWFRVYGSHADNYNMFDITLIPGSQPPELEFKIHHDTKNKILTGHMILDGNGHILDFIKPSRQVIYKYLTYELPNYYIVLFKNVDTNFVGIDVYSRSDQPNQKYLLKLARSTLQSLDLNYILIESNLVQVKIKSALNQIDNNELVLPKTPTEQIILYEMIGRWYRLYGSHESDFSVNDITITPGSQPPEIVFTFRNDKSNVNVKNLLKFENNQYILVNNANGNRLQYRFLYYEPTSFYIVESISNNNKIRIDMFSRTDETNENTRKMVLKIMIKLGLNYPIQPLTGPTHWMPELVPNNGFPKVPTVQTVMNQLTGRWYRVYGSKQREYNTYEITYISGTQPPEMQFVIHHDTDNKTETGRMIVSGNDYVVYFAISDIKPIVYKYLWYDLPNYFIILYKNTDTDAVGVDVISRYDKPKQNYLLKTAKHVLESLKLDYPLIETDLVPIKIKSAMTQVDNKLVVLPNKPTAQIVLYELTGRWFRIYSTQETNTNINDITYTYGSQPPEINYILSNVDNSQVVRNMLKIENNEYILVNTATGSRLSYRFLHYEPTAFYIIYFNSSTNNNDNNDINAGVHVFSRNDNSDNNLLNLSTKILQQLGLNFKLLSVKDSTDLSRNLINKYNNDLPNATAIQKPILTNELPNIPSIQTLTNKMTGRWYLMYSTNMNDYNVNDITNIPGSQPNKLKWFRKSSYVNVNYKVGHVTLLNNRYVAEENGIKILFKFVDYQPNKYMIFQYLNLKTNEVGVDVFTRSDKSDPIVLKIANQALKQLNINGKLSSDPKPKNQLTDPTNDKIDLPRVPTMQTLLRQMTGRWFRVFGTQQDWHMNINDIEYIPESQPPEFRWILRSESDPRKYDQGSLLIDGNYRTYVFDRLKIKGSLNYLNYDPTKYFIGHYYREATHDYGVDVYSRSYKSNQNDLLELANHTLKRLGLKYRLIPVQQLESNIKTTDFSLLPISLPKIPTMSQSTNEMTGVWYRIYGSRLESFDIFNISYIPDTQPPQFNYDIRDINNRHHYVLRVRLEESVDNLIKLIRFDNNEEYDYNIINYDPAKFYILKEIIDKNDVSIDVYSRVYKQDLHLLDIAYRTLNNLKININLIPVYPQLPQNSTLTTTTTTGAGKPINQTLPNIPSLETMTDKMTGRWYEIYGTNINSDNVYDITYIPNTQPPQWEWIIRNNLNKYYVMARGKLDGNQYTLDYTASDVKYIINYLNYKSSTFFIIKSENTFDKTAGVRVFSRSYSNNREQLEILDIAKQTMAQLNLNYKIDQADSLKWLMNYVNNKMLPKLLPRVPSTEHIITRLTGPWHRIYSSQLAGPLGYSITYISRTLPPQLKFDITNGSTNIVSTYTVQIKLVGKQYQFVRTDTDQLTTVEFLNYRSKYYKIIKTIDDNNKVIIDVYSRSAKQNQTQLDIAYRTLYRLGYNVNLLTIDQQPAVSDNKTPTLQTTGANTPEAPEAVTAEQLPRVPPLYTYITKFTGRWTRVFSSELNNDGFYGYNIVSIPNTQPPQLEFKIQYLNHINVSIRYEIQLLDKTYLLIDTNTKSQTKVDFLNYDSNSYFIVKSLKPNTDSDVIDVYSRSDKPNLTVQEIAKWTLEMLGLNNITLLTVFGDTPVVDNNDQPTVVLPDQLSMKTPHVFGQWNWMYGSDRTGFKSITSAYVNGTQPYVAIIAKENENKYITGSLRPKIDGNNEFEFIMDGNNNQVFATIEILNYESGCFVMSKSIFINDPTTYIDVFGVSNKPNKTILNIAEQTLRQLGLDYTLLSIDDKYVPDISRIITNDVTPPPPEITTISDEINTISEEISPTLPEITTTTTTTSLSTTTEKIAELLATPSPVARDFVAKSLKTDNFNWLEGKWYELYATLKNNKLCAQTVFNRTGSQSELTFTTFNDCSKLSSGLLKKLPNDNSQLAMIGKDLTASLWILDTGAETQKTHFLALKSFNFQDDVIENYILFSRTSKLSDPDMTKIVEQLARLVSHAKLVPTLHPDKCTCNH